MKKFFCLLTISQLIVSPAGAHSWYPRECCHNDDCHPVPCGELTTTRYGLSWKDVAVFSEPMIRSSPDGACHVCGMWGHYSTILPYLPLCVFLPNATS
jgi:hypothetical protein